MEGGNVMEKSNKKNRSFLLFFIFLLTAVLTICVSFTLAKYMQTANLGSIILDITKDSPVLYKGFAEKYNLRNNGTTKIVFDSWNNQKDLLGLTDDDWAKNTNYAQEADGNPGSSDNLRGRIKVFQIEDTAYVLTERNYPVVFPADSSSMFEMLYNITSIDFNLIGTKNIENMTGMFGDCWELTELDLSKFDTRNVIDMQSMFLTDMSWMFSECSGLTTLNLSNFSTTKVTTSNMSGMFSECSALRQITLGKDFKFAGTNGYLPAAAAGSNWYVQGNTSTPLTPAQIATNQRSVTAATTYVQMETPPVLSSSVIMNLNSSITKIVFDNWNNQKDKLGYTDTVWENNTNYAQEGNGKRIKLFTVGTTAYILADGNNVIAFPEDSSYLFNNYNGATFTSIEFNSIDTSNVKNMNSMFSYCSGLTTLDLSNFNTNKVTDMANMFSSCSSLTTLNVSNFDTSNVTEMYSMFFMCSSLKTLDLSSWNTSNVTTVWSMFQDCYALTTLDLSNFDNSLACDTGAMFSNCTSLNKIILGPKFQFYDNEWGMEYLLPEPASGTKWYVNGQSTALTPEQLADYQVSVTSTTTYIRK